jgi:hypothetical protein
MGLGMMGAPDKSFWAQTGEARASKPKIKLNIFICGF